VRDMGQEVGRGDLERVRVAAAQFRTEPARGREIHDRFGNVTAFWQRTNYLLPDTWAVVTPLSLCPQGYPSEPTSFRQGVSRQGRLARGRSKLGG